MGRKRAGGRKQIFLCFAVLIPLSLAACSFIKPFEYTPSKATNEVKRKPKEVEARRHLHLGSQFLAKGDYGNALKEDEKALALAGKESPADEALFFIALVCAHPGNQAKNYEKSLAAFKKMLKDHPKSPLTEQAKVIVGLLQENDRSNRAIEKLNNVIEELKNVDVKVEQKRREKAR